MEKTDLDEYGLALTSGCDQNNPPHREKEIDEEPEDAPGQQGCRCAVDRVVGSNPPATAASNIKTARMQSPTVQVGLQVVRTASS